MIISSKFFSPLGLLLAALFCCCSNRLNAQPRDPAVFKNLNFRFIGPEGNRAIAVAGEPGNPMVNYIGAASGGLWKTEDGGISWKPMTDSLDVSSVGTVALAPGNPDQVWMGTGETFIIRPAHAMGDGIYKSDDAGKTYDVLNERLQAAKAKFDELVENDIARFNKKLNKLDRKIDIEKKLQEGTED